ncbi:hypothetical protein CspeluHIS016_0504420 [Cutaneotrichosporon spelunceum]|uniref:SH3 domain-containing protein n=1 Tax=Cutaneotrichosporon spelunceum TaxID=1672016 RepID=A0AAD3TWX8_9TREE|nr:hypothetical protein CspeluHIS016_0504420 [Cutaneotrichosporon spelunceum]
MAAPQPAQALASHLVSQTLASVGLLETLQLITPADATEIRARLPNPYTQFPALATPAANTSQAGVVASMDRMNISPPAQPVQPVQPAQSPVHTPAPFQATPFQGPHVPGPTLPPRYATPPSNEKQARALWDYNGADAEDLRFRQGDVIVIDEEVNKEWYRGHLVGGSVEKGGLFPANYVEKIVSGTRGEKDAGDMVPYQPPGAASSYYSPPSGQVQQYASPMPPMQQAAGGATIVVQDEKKNKFGKLGGNLGNAAVTGAGFGFGSAVASNIVNAIL